MGGKCKLLKDVVQLEYEDVYQKGQADPDIQRPGKWSSSVFSWSKACVRAAPL